AAATDPWAAADQAAASSGCTVLLKGVPTVVAAQGRVVTVAAGNPGLATGGSGDLLGGLIATFLAQGVNPLHSAALGAQALGNGAEQAAREFGMRGMRPMQVVSSMQAVWQSWRNLQESPRDWLVEMLAPFEL
ncbi:MAG TPA: NAD(P)H-hydrate dehydratase, partial [Gemmatimonadales bacterium]|nr:NAD(P)H-hydrate dehydratase [Gemmatimonadales bacterium]